MDTSAQLTVITLEEWEQRKLFVDFTAEDVRLLAELNPISATSVDEVVDGTCHYHVYHGRRRGHLAAGA